MKLAPQQALNKSPRVTTSLPRSRRLRSPQWIRAPDAFIGKLAGATGTDYMTGAKTSRVSWDPEQAYPAAEIKDITDSRHMSTDQLQADLAAVETKQGVFGKIARSGPCEATRQRQRRQGIRDACRIRPREYEGGFWDVWQLGCLGGKSPRDRMKKTVPIMRPWALRRRQASFICPWGSGPEERRLPGEAGLLQPDGRRWIRQTAGQWEHERRVPPACRARPCRHEGGFFRDLWLRRQYGGSLYPHEEPVLRGCPGRRPNSDGGRYESQGIRAIDLEPSRPGCDRRGSGSQGRPLHEGGSSVMPRS